MDSRLLSASHLAFSPALKVEIYFPSSSVLYFIDRTFHKSFTYDVVQ